MNRETASELFISSVIARARDGVIASIMDSLKRTPPGRKPPLTAIARHDWFTAPEEPEMVFDAERGALWERALSRRTQQL